MTIEGIWYKGYIILKVWYNAIDCQMIEELNYKQTELGIIQKYVLKYKGEITKSKENEMDKLVVSFNVGEKV